jgi:hypothetical protein
MSEVKITITGLSLCKPNFSTERGLEVLFIHPLKLIEDKHTLILTIKKGLHNSTGQKPVINTINLVGKNKISLIFENTDPSPSTGLPNFNDKVDFDFYYGRPLSLYKSPYTETSYLSIPGAQPFIAQYNDPNTFTISEFSSAGPIPISVKQRVAKSVGTKFEIRDAGNLTIKIEGALSTDIRLPFEAGMDYEIEFDNRDVHHEDIDKNDYQLYYEILDGQDAAGRRFILVFQKDNEETDQQACNVAKGGGGCDFLRFYNTGNC